MRANWCNATSTRVGAPARRRCKDDGTLGVAVGTEVSSSYQRLVKKNVASGNGLAAGRRMAWNHTWGSQRPLHGQTDSRLVGRRWHVRGSEIAHQLYEGSDSRQGTNAPAGPELRVATGRVHRSRPAA